MLLLQGIRTKVAMESQLRRQSPLGAADALSRKVFSSSVFYTCHLTQRQRLAVFSFPQELSNPIKRLFLQATFVQPHNGDLPIGLGAITERTPGSCDYSSEGINKAG
jgi:hypothetical protein